jgi:hypothetical protein
VFAKHPYNPCTNKKPPTPPKRELISAFMFFLYFCIMYIEKKSVNLWQKRLEEKRSKKKEKIRKNLCLQSIRKIRVPIKNQCICGKKEKIRKNPCLQSIRKICVPKNLLKKPNTHLTYNQLIFILYLQKILYYESIK